MKLRFLILLCALVFPGVMTWLYFILLAGPHGEQNPAMQGAMAFGKLVQFTLPLMFVWWVDRSQLGWPLFRSRGFYPALGFGLLTALAMFVLYFGGLREMLRNTSAPGEIWQKLAELNCTTPGRYLFLALVICLAHSLLEEYYWRWFVFGQLRRLIQWRSALVVSSLGFMVHHVLLLGVYFPDHFWTLAVPFSLAVAVGGGVWAWLYEYSRSLYGIWLSHLLVDAAILLVGYDMLRGYFR